MKIKKIRRLDASGRIILGLLLLLSFVGCYRDTYHDPEMDFGTVETVAVMPFINLTRDTAASIRVRDVLMTRLLATYGLYVLPPGEVARGIAKAGVGTPTEPSPEDVVKFAKTVEVDAVMIGTLREYGEARSGQTASPVISLSLQMLEGETGTVVWSASSTKGGVGIVDRLLGSGGKPMNGVTEQAIDDLIQQLFK